MSGQEKFQRRIEESVGGVLVIQTVIAKILNLDDSDVRYACGAGIMSGGHDYAEVMRRGQEKAMTSFLGMPESLTEDALIWAKALAPFSGTTLHVEVSGTRDPMGRAFVAGEDEDRPSFYFWPGEVLASIEVVDGLDGQRFAVKAEIQLRPETDLPAWLRLAREHLALARRKAEEIKALGVTVSEE